MIVIEPLASGAVHIRVARMGGKIALSDLRIPHPKLPAFTVRETAKEVQVNTEGMRVVLNRAGQTFACSPDERLFSLGQFQNGPCPVTRGRKSAEARVTAAKGIGLHPWHPRPHPRWAVSNRLRAVRYGRNAANVGTRSV